MRVWVRGMPGGDETEVVAGTITEVREDGAVLYLREPGREQRWVLAVPQEPGWGLQALWFSFIAVDAFELDGADVAGALVHPPRIAAVKQLAAGVWQLRGFPPNAINVYLVEDVLIDAATRRAGKRILRPAARDAR